MHYDTFGLVIVLMIKKKQVYRNGNIYKTEMNSF